DDFDRRMEMRRQRREQMRLEAQNFGGANGEDDEEAREQRRRAREERKRMREAELSAVTDVADTNRYGVKSRSSRGSAGMKHTTTTFQRDGADDDQVLLERLAKREERRQRRMKEAMERQKENGEGETDGAENDSSLQPTDKQIPQNESAEESETSTTAQEPEERAGVEEEKEQPRYKRKKQEMEEKKKKE
uniref:Caldesmon 1b n=1 Tax=Tetraodon nigroviridis TaxID=99883 RepID=H3DEZ1_TETNG